MPARQTEYTQYMNPAFEGMVADMSDAQIISLRNGTIAAFPFGRVVTIDPTKDRTGALGGAAAFQGVSTREHNVWAEHPNGVAPNDMIQTIRHGAVWVKVKAAVVAGADATYDPADGAFTAGGTAIAGIKAFYRDSAAAGEMTVVLLS